MNKSTAASGASARSIRIVLVAGPSGSGKTTIGRALALHLGWAFEDADDYHAPEAVAKMASGEGLTDADREPWLDGLTALIAERASGGEPTVLACSALTRASRQRLMGAGSGVVLVWLEVPREILRQRLDGREGHFAGADLLPSQLAAAETPTPEEQVMVLDGTERLQKLLAGITEAVYARSRLRSGEESL